MNGTVVQIDFSEIAASGSADFNVIAKIDLTPFKADMGDFPYKYFKNISRTIFTFHPSCEWIRRKKTVFLIP